MDQNPNGPGGFDAPRYRDVQTWRRSRSDRMIAGVCGGVGRALNIDPVLIRVVVAVLTLAGGAGIPIYIAAWLLMPEEGTEKTAAQDMFGRRVRTDHPWLWPVVIGIGIFCAVGISSSLDMWPFSFPGPLVAIFLIWFLISRRKHNRGQGHWHGARQWQPTGQDAGQDAGQQQWTAPAAPPAGSSYPAGPASSVPTQRLQDRPQDSVNAGTSGAVPPGPVWAEDDPLGLYVDDEPVAPPATTTQTMPVRRRRWVKPAVASLTAIAIGIALLAQATLPMALAIGLVTLGGGMVLGALLGRTRGLLPLGLLLVLGVGVTQTFETVPDFGDRQLAPTGTFAAATPVVYDMGVGSMRLDLTGAKFENGAKIVAHGQVGEITVILPPNLDVSGTVNLKAAGEINALGQRKDGTKAVLQFTDVGQDLKKGPPAITLDVTMKFGSIVVERG